MSEDLHKNLLRLSSLPPTIVSPNVSSPRHHFSLFASILSIFPRNSTHQSPHVPPLFPKKVFPPHPDCPWQSGAVGTETSIGTQAASGNR
jgi:hypothetical protein